MLSLLPVPLWHPITAQVQGPPSHPPQVLWSKRCTRAICVEPVTLFLPKPYLMPLPLWIPHPPSLSLETCSLV